MTMNQWWEIGGVGYVVIVAVVLRRLSHSLPGAPDEGSPPKRPIV